MDWLAGPRICGLALPLLVACSDAPRVVKHPDNVLSATVKWRTASESASEVRFGHGDQSFVLGSSEKTKKHSVFVYGLRADTDYDFEVASDGEALGTVSWTSGTPPELVQRVEVDDYDPERAVEGWTLTNLMSPKIKSVVVMYDMEGFPVWYRELKGDGGVIDATWTERDTVLIGGTMPRGDKASEIELDGTELWSGEGQIGEHKTGYQHHHLQRLPGGDLLSLENVQIDEVLGDRVVRTTADGERLWEWSTFDHFDPPSDHFDWTHANWAGVDGDLVLVSLAGLNRVVAFDPESGDIAWELGEGGDFELVGDSRWFRFQHAPVVLPDDHLLVYDNQGWPQRTRVTEYALDHEAGTATVVWQYGGGEDNPWHAPFMGSVQPLDGGNVLIAAGGDLDDRRVFEIDDTGEVVWQMRGPRVYRARRIPALVPVEE